jgi:hypothetical protein
MLIIRASIISGARRLAEASDHDSRINTTPDNKDSMSAFLYGASAKVDGEQLRSIQSEAMLTCKISLLTSICPEASMRKHSRVATVYAPYRPTLCATKASLTSVVMQRFAISITRDSRDSWPPFRLLNKPCVTV